MRGAEHPSKVQWTRPFLRPLMPLTEIAAHQTFIEIADGIHDDLEVNQLLNITDNIPLAFQLVATVAASEGCCATLYRWKLERTAMLSAGHNKRSNLEISIILSLSSPRMSSLPRAVDLLSLMSLLPDGISDTDLVQSKPPIPEILTCKTTLVRTSLAYVDPTGRLKLLAPIREYIYGAIPPSSNLVQPLQKHLSDLLKLWTTWLQGSPLPAGGIHQLFSNLGNLHNLLLHALKYGPANLVETMKSIILLNRLNLIMNRGLTPLMMCMSELLPKIDDHRIHGQFITEAFQAYEFNTITNPEKSIDEGMKHFQMINDVEGEGEL